MSKPTIHTACDLDEPITLDYDTVLDALLDGEVHAEHGMMRWGSNYTFLVTVTHGEHQFMGIYKPRMGERPLWDFPDGTLCQRETAAFVVSEMLDWDIVPPTVLREGPRGMGSVQAFINHDPHDHYFTIRESEIYEVVMKQIQQMAAFDAIVNNADRKGGHCLLDEDQRVWGIDHGLTFHPAHKLRTVIWDFAGHPIAEDILLDLQALCGKLSDETDAGMQQLLELINSHELSAMKTRVDRLVQTGVYPMPGPGPNRPWPAV